MVHVVAAEFDIEEYFLERRMYVIYLWDVAKVAFSC